MNATDGTVQAAGHAFDVEVRELPARRFAVRRHDGTVADVDATRRPLYQHLILNELVGGPPVLRFPADHDAEGPGKGDDGTGLDVLVGTVGGFDGDGEVTVETVPAGWFAVLHYEGPEDTLPDARRALRAWAAEQGHAPDRPVYQVHLMDPIDGEAEQELQYPLSVVQTDRERAD